MTAQIIPFNEVKDESKWVCSFCKTPKTKVKKMVGSSSGKSICDKCITKCSNLLKQESTQ